MAGWEHWPCAIHDNHHSVPHREKHFFPQQFFHSPHWRQGVQCLSNKTLGCGNLVSTQQAAVAAGPPTGRHKVLVDGPQVIATAHLSHLRGAPYPAPILPPNCFNMHYHCTNMTQPWCRHLASAPQDKSDRNRFTQWRSKLLHTVDRSRPPVPPPPRTPPPYPPRTSPPYPPVTPPRTPPVPPRTSPPYPPPYPPPL